MCPVVPGPFVGQPVFAPLKCVLSCVKRQLPALVWVCSGLWNRLRLKDGQHWPWAEEMTADGTHCDWQEGVRSRERRAQLLCERVCTEAGSGSGIFRRSRGTSRCCDTWSWARPCPAQPGHCCGHHVLAERNNQLPSVPCTFTG